MDKAAILKLLKEALEDYKCAMTSTDLFYLLSAKCMRYGLCDYLNNKNHTIKEVAIDELSKDVYKKQVINTASLSDPKNYYWYSVPNTVIIQNNMPEEKQYKVIRKKSIKPRLEHLQRTINRLENELKNQPTI